MLQISSDLSCVFPLEMSKKDVLSFLLRTAGKEELLGLPLKIRNVTIKQGRQDVERKGNNAVREENRRKLGNNEATGKTNKLSDFRKQF